MSGQGGEREALRETLIDFAMWLGEWREDAEWSAETYLHEKHPTPPSEGRA